MTIDELLARESIRHTLACYNIAGDRLKRDDFVAVFTEDAVFESENSFRNVGKPAIEAWINGWGANPKPGGRRPTFVRHNLTTSKIELTGPETARARTYWIVFTDVGADHCGEYADEFRRTSERWLISHRRIRVHWRAADSFFNPDSAR